MKIRSLISKLVFRSICLFLSFFVLFSISIPANKIMAQTYDIVVETEMNEITVKLLEINYSENIVHFYKFDSNGNPVYDEEEQVTFTPGDEMFEEYIEYLTGALIVNELTIQSNQEFSFQIYYENLSDWEMVLQLCYDGGSDYRLYEHHELDDPFDVNSAIGDFSILFVGEETYTGFKYTVNTGELKWNRTNTQGLDFGNDYAEIKKMGGTGRPSFKITGKTSSGKNIKIEDKGDGKGPKVYTGEDKNGNGKIDDDEWTEVTDLDEIEDLLEEVASDLENGTGDYEGEAFDGDGNPIDLIFFFQKLNGDYICFGITKEGDLSGITLTHDEMVQKGIIASGEERNPRGAWFVGTRTGDTSKFSFEKYARFKKVGDKWVPDPTGEPYPYHFNVFAEKEPFPLFGGRLCWTVDFEDWWP